MSVCSIFKMLSRHAISYPQMNYTYAQIGRINLPILVSLLMEQLINLTDSIFLGHVSSIDLGASALAAMYYSAIYMLGFGFSLGAQVVIARRNGEELYTDAGRVFYQALLFLFVNIAVYLLYLFALSRSPHIPLAVYWTAEQLYVIVLFVLSLAYFKRNKWQSKIL